MRKNPFSRHGAATRLAERLPVVNNVIQGIHHRAGDLEALDRARRINPLRIRSDSFTVRAAERIPLVNNVVQSVHRARGKEEALERARERNPLGHAGYLTQMGEHIPVVADTIRCIHKFRGHTADAERARAFSLARLVDTNGAILKLAELLPGTNVVAALVHELRGDQEEAVRALNIIKQWKDVASADGALAKLAELFPGCDIIAFGIMATSGHYASALRAVCKTRWVHITSKSTVLLVSMERVEDWSVLDVESDLEVAPRAASLAGGVIDLFIHWLDFNSHGARRWTQIRRSCSSENVIRRQGVRGLVQKEKVLKANENLQGIIASVMAHAPEAVGWCVDLTNWALYEWRPETFSSWVTMRALSILFPPMPFRPPPDPGPGARLALAFQSSLTDVTALHGPMPLNPASFSVPLRRRRAEEQRGVPELAAGIACLSFLGCAGLGAHTGALACLCGCGAGLSAAHRRVKRNLTLWLNQSNASVWHWMSAPVVPAGAEPKRRSSSSSVSSAEVGRRPSGLSPGASRCSSLAPEEEERRSSGCPSPAQAERAGVPQGIIFEWSQQVLESLHAAEHLREYLARELLNPRRPLNWVHPMCWVWQLFERQLCHFLEDALDGQCVPLVVPIPLGAGMYSGIQTWLPEIRVMLILWLRFTDHLYITRLQVAVVDGMLDRVINAVKSQVLPRDLRQLDARLAGFAAPVNLEFDVALRWIRENRLRVELNDVHATLHLPK